MTKYRYVKTGEFIQGLPAQDLDDSDLSDLQKQLLAAGVEQGLYEAAAKPVAKKKPEDKDDARQ